MADIPNMRRVYSRPWRDGGLANPGKVSTGIAVGMRPETTLITHETMLDALPQRPTARTGLAGVGRIDVLRAPDHMVCCLIDTIPVVDYVNHRLNYTSHGALRASAIPPAT